MPRAGAYAVAVRRTAGGANRSVVQRAGERDDELDLQRAVGNRAFAEIVSLQRSGCGPSCSCRGCRDANDDDQTPPPVQRLALQRVQRLAGNSAAAQLAIQRAGPFIKRIKVHLAPPQTAELEWQGTPPEDAPGSDSFTVSTGKGYSDRGDPAGTCTRECCKDPEKQCAPPWNQPGRVGACCTFYGDSFWAGRTRPKHNEWKHWTPIEPYHSRRGIALHAHPEVTGQPIGHGCVRMDEENAARIRAYHRGRRTNITIDGRAAPVKADDDELCDERGKRKKLEPHPDLLEPGTFARPGAEGEAE